MMTQVFVLPTSSGHQIFILFGQNRRSLVFSPPARAGEAPETEFRKLFTDVSAPPALVGDRFEACGPPQSWFPDHHHLPREPQIHGIHAPGACPPLVDILRQQVIAVGEIGVAEMHKNRRRIARAAPNPVSVARISVESERSTSLMRSSAPGRACSISS